MGFAEHYDIGKFRTGHVAGCRSARHARTHHDDVFAPAVKAHLLELRSQNRLGMTGGIAGRDVWTATDWNEFVTTGIFSRWLLTSMFEMVMHRAHHAARAGSPFDPPSLAADITADDRVRRAWERLCRLMDEGTSGHEWLMDPVQDGMTGDRCRMEFVGWQPGLTYWNGRSFEPAQDVEAIELAEVTIDCPTGVLLITDCISLEDALFHRVVDSGPAWHADTSLNSHRGAISHATAMASLFGFTEIITDNTVVSVHRKGDLVLVCEANADEEMRITDGNGDVVVAGWERAGGFSCDRHMTLVADRHAVERTLELGGLADADQAVAAWIDEMGGQCATVQVSPGRYRVRFGPDFTKRFDRGSLGIPNGPEIWLTIEPVAV